MIKDKYKHAYMDMAVRFGQTSTATKLKVGALIVKDDFIISQGVNGQPPGWETEVCEDENNITLPTVRHAEEAALQKLWNSHETSKGASIFISHAPCLHCAIKIVTAGIEKVYYRNIYRCDKGLDYLKSKGVGVEKV